MRAGSKDNDKTPPPADRDTRLAAALKANLARRKAQARARAAEAKKDEKAG